MRPNVGIERIEPDSVWGKGGEDCSIFYLELTGRGVASLIRKISVGETAILGLIAK